MRAFVLGFVLASFAGAASANCTGTGAFQTCYDAQSGNSYTVNRSANTTNMNGFNPNTGSTWNQNSYRSGNTTNIYGTASDGSSWNQTTINNGSSRTIMGTDSRGNSYSKTCNAYGCF